MGMLHFNFLSEKLGYTTNLYVVLPDSVREGNVPKGILYLLHGGGGNGLDWIRYSSIERYTWPYEIAAVMVEADGSCFYADMKYGYPYFTYLTEEIPRVLEALCPILKGVDKRYVAGFSMGGYGAYKWAFNKPDYFKAAANFSGISPIVELLGEQGGVNGHELDGRMKLVEENWGSLDELRGSDSDSIAWIDRASKEHTKLPALFAGIGTEDFSYEMGLKYLAYCKEKGILIHYEEMPGGHEWSVWDEMVKRFLKWAVEVEDAEIS